MSDRFDGLTQQEKHLLRIESKLDAIMTRMDKEWGAFGECWHVAGREPPRRLWMQDFYEQAYADNLKGWKHD